MNLKHNIIKLYLLKALKWFMIVMPIIVLFFESKGLSLTQIMILQGTYSLFVALFEIPSGFFADIYGRKNSILIGSIFLFLGYVIFSFFSGFNEFLFAEILLGIGGSLISGADSAILYDTLLEIKEDNEYTKIEGKTYAIGNFSEGIAGISALLSSAVPEDPHPPCFLTSSLLLFSSSIVSDS